MKIGFDMSVIQTAHRMRGIGAVAINVVSNLSQEAKKLHSFVLYMYQEGQDEALALLDLSGVNYEVRVLQPQRPIKLPLPGRLRILNSAANYLHGIYASRQSDPREADLSDIDYYLQFDQAQTPPKRHGLKTAVVLYDLIPYVMEADYLWSYQTSRQHGLSRKSSLRKALVRKRYLDQVASVAKNTDKLFAISKYTKEDFIRYAGTPADKIDVVHLGVSSIETIAPQQLVKFSRYIKNSWGHFPQAFDITDKPFLLFVGGADPRRRLIDLAAAFNAMRAQGIDIRLVLAGDTMKSPDAMPHTVQHYIKSSSYFEDIAFLGFVTNDQRDWLYGHATALVYPSVYEGFGLPVLEAMRYGTPVITYDNTSIREIAGKAALYASDAASIQQQAQKLILDPKLRRHYADQGKKQAARFSWPRTSKEILDLLLS